MGYKTPPKHSQFKKGQSGNPKGRPKGRKNIHTTVLKLGNRVLESTENGNSQKVTVIDGILMNLFKKALGGDLRFIKEALNLWQGAQEYQDAFASKSGSEREQKKIITSFLLRSGIMEHAAAEPRPKVSPKMIFGP